MAVCCFVPAFVHAFNSSGHSTTILISAKNSENVLSEHPEAQPDP